MANLRTTLQWLDEQEIARTAEAWVLTDTHVLPIVRASPAGEGGYFNLRAFVGDVIFTCLPVWSEPPPSPLSFGTIYDTLLERYAGGGELLLDEKSSHFYRGSYTVDPTQAIFFLFLPERFKLIETHSERMEKRKQQARELTEEIENAWQL